MAIVLPAIFWFAIPAELVDAKVQPLPESVQPVIPVGEIVAPPFGFVQMCKEDPAACEIRSAQPLSSSEATLRSRVAPRPPATAKRITARRMTKMLRKVNVFVNRQVVQMSDRSRFGVDERWAASGVGATGAGDCEDIAIEKRRELLAAGFPAEHLRYAAVYSQRAGLHTVLVAEVGAKAYVLDNRTNGMLNWSRTDYRWLAVQADGHQWRRVRTS